MSSQRIDKRWWALGVIALAQFITIMDTSIIGVALPDIQRTLGFSQDGLSWVFNAYVIAFGGLLLLGGRLSDLFGARSVFISGWTVLIGGSLLAGLAESPSSRRRSRSPSSGSSMRATRAGAPPRPLAC